MKILKPELPFVWPEPRITTGIAEYSQEPAYGSLVEEFQSVFGVVSGLTFGGVDWVEDWFKRSDGLRAKLIVALYPTCETRTEDLARLLDLVGTYPERLEVRLHPLEWVTDRSSNVLCFLSPDKEPHFSVGPTDNLGVAIPNTAAANFVFRGDASLTEAFKRYFDYLWASSMNITYPGATKIPHLILPEGTKEAARAWQEYSASLSEHTSLFGDKDLVAVVDQESGDVTLTTIDGVEAASPSEDLGLKKLDPVADRVARLYEKGALVSIDKRSRIPPLDCPVDPSVFGDDAEIHKGTVVRRVSLSVSVIDEATLKSIEKCRTGSRSVLTKFTFGLADNMRWLPNKARRLLEAELKDLNESGQQLISSLLKGDLDTFLKGKREGLVTDLEGMQKQVGKTGTVKPDTVDHVLESLKVRLQKAQFANFMPSLTYSTIGFAVTETEFVSPWGQAFSVVYDMAVFPRKVLTDAFFLRGIKPDEEDMIEAMNVADDDLVKDLRSRGIKDRCHEELDLLAEIEKSQVEPRKKCILVFRVIDGGTIHEIRKDLVDQAKKAPGG